MTDTQLWALLIEGPDDLYAMPSLDHAQEHVIVLRSYCNRISAETGVTLRPKVIPWPHSSQSHAANMREHLKDFS
jgi:hypothetical protein